MSTKTADELKTRAWMEIDRKRPRLEELSRTIHAHPEIRFTEQKAREWLCEFLEDEGFEVEKGIGGLETAFKAEYTGKGNGPKIGFLAEYDALAKIGHACGHNLIGPSSLGAATGLKAVLGDLSASVTVVGTPGEEGGGGKVILAEAGVFDDLDAAMMVHPSGNNTLWKHSLGRRKLNLEFFGRSTHASAFPEKGINALDALIATFNNIAALRQQIEDTSRIHGVITNGGESPNVIPDYTSALFYVRAIDDETCDRLLERVIDCARGAATATGCELKHEMTGSYKALKNNMVLVDLFESNGKNLGVTFKETDPDKHLGSTDMGDVSRRVPAIHPSLTIASDGTELLAHTIEFREAAITPRAFDAMILSAKIMAGVALDLLTDREVFEEMKREFEE